MKIQLVYLRSKFDGFEVHPEFDLGGLPVPGPGQTVFLPDDLLPELEAKQPYLLTPQGMTQRYEVVDIDHNWKSGRVTVLISVLNNPEFHGRGSELTGDIVLPLPAQPGPNHS